MAKKQHQPKRNVDRGLVFQSVSGRDPLFYTKKQQAEHLAGRSLTIEEFLEKWYVDDSQLTGTSIFDPVLCELSYRWFCPPGGRILDPFAGGSVRGIVAGMLGYRYTGIDLSARQIEANRIQAQTILPKERQVPTWIHGDSSRADQLLPAAEGFDFVFTCPPYFDLETYSDDPADLSTMKPAAFIEAYRRIIASCCRLLKDDRFAAIVVGDVRGPDGCYLNLPGETIAAFAAAGLKLYNEALLVTPVGSLAIRVGRAFRDARKLGKSHQNVLVFVKGDPEQACKACGQLGLGSFEDGMQDLGAVQVPDDVARQIGEVFEKPADVATADLGSMRLERLGDLDVLSETLAGGTKERALIRFIPAVPEMHLVYASPREGYAQLALARVGARTGKKITIFVPKAKQLSRLSSLAAAAGAEIIEVPHGYLTNLQAKAREFCATNGARLLPFGLDFEEMVQAIADVAREQYPDRSPHDVWCACGSGVLSRALKRAFPQAKIHAVRVGAESKTDADEVLVAPEKFSADAEIKPPFSSCENYDAKVWRFAQGKSGLLWNVALGQGGALIPDVDPDALPDVIHGTIPVIPIGPIASGVQIIPSVVLQLQPAPGQDDALAIATGSVNP